MHQVPGTYQYQRWLGDCYYGPLVAWFGSANPACKEKVTSPFHGKVLFWDTKLYQTHIVMGCLGPQEFFTPENGGLASDIAPLWFPPRQSLAGWLSARRPTLEMDPIKQIKMNFNGIIVFSFFFNVRESGQSRCKSTRNWLFRRFAMSRHWFTQKRKLPNIASGHKISRVHIVQGASFSRSLKE